MVSKNTCILIDLLAVKVNLNDWVVPGKYFSSTCQYSRLVLLTHELWQVCHTFTDIDRVVVKTTQIYLPAVNY